MRTYRSCDSGSLGLIWQQNVLDERELRILEKQNYILLAFQYHLPLLLCISEPTKGYYGNFLKLQKLRNSN